jgi:site-specific recombinase XerD
LNDYARRLSIHTIADYTNTFTKFAAFLGADLPIANISADQIRQFLAVQRISKKTALNYHAGLSALWRWATGEGLTERNIVHQVQPPKPEIRIAFATPSPSIFCTTAATCSSYNPSWAIPPCL